MKAKRKSAKRPLRRAVPAEEVNAALMRVVARGGSKAVDAAAALIGVRPWDVSGLSPEAGEPSGVTCAAGHEFCPVED